MPKLRFAIPLLSITLTACAPPVDAGADDDPRSAVRALEAETGVAWTARFHSDLGTPAILEGRTAPLLQPRDAADHVAHAFLASHPGLFRTPSPRDQLAADTVERDELGMSHVRLAQVHEGLPVWGHELRVHFAADGALVRIEGRFAPLAPLPRATPDVTPDDAKTAAVSTLAAGHDVAAASAAGEVDVDAPSLVVDAVPDPAAGTASARLAYRVEVRLRDPVQPLRREIFVDAATAEAYRVTDLVSDLRGSGTGVFGETREFEIASSGKLFTLADATVGNPAQRIYTAKNTQRLPGTLVSSSRADRWDEGVAGAGSAVDAQANLELIEDYWSRVHGRRGASGHGEGMRATVHFGQRFANAFFDGKQLVFGDGVPGKMAPLAGGLDVTAHEFTHAVIEASCRLGATGESGALNEAMADVFACFVEHAERKSGANWHIGEDVLLGARGASHGLRDLTDPHATGGPAHVDEEVPTAEDNGGVHENSTIVGHAAWLMTEGGQNRVSGIRVDGIGEAASERVWYRALTRYLGPSAEFIDAAEATVTAARDLFGPKSKEAASVLRAWQAVGVAGQ